MVCTEKYIICNDSREAQVYVRLTQLLKNATGGQDFTKKKRESWIREKNVYAHADDMLFVRPKRVLSVH